MRLLTSIFIIFFLLNSCKNENFICKDKKIIGKYYCQDTDSYINIKIDGSGNLITTLPNFSSFNMKVQLIQDGCSFYLSSFYDNYAPSNQGPHYWMSGTGSGRFEDNMLLLKYDITVRTDNYIWDSGNIIGTNSTFSEYSFSCVYEKI